MLDAAAEREALEAFFPYLVRVGARAREEHGRAWWRRSTSGSMERRAGAMLLDRIEIGFALEPADAQLRRAGGAAARAQRRARSTSTPLVEAARASLLEEGRPDPTESDPIGFRRWVRGRVRRAVVVEEGGAVGFVGYADVQSPRGWLLQGVYTWPAFRRRGLAAVGVSELCRRAFASGGGARAAGRGRGKRGRRALYERLGFQRFARLRTMLFA